MGALSANLRHGGRDDEGVTRLDVLAEELIKAGFGRVRVLTGGVDALELLSASFPAASTP